MAECTWLIAGLWVHHITTPQKPYNITSLFLIDCPSTYSLHTFPHIINRKKEDMKIINATKGNPISGCIQIKGIRSKMKSGFDGAYKVGLRSSEPQYLIPSVRMRFYDIINVPFPVINFLQISSKNCTRAFQPNLNSNIYIFLLKFNNFWYFFKLLTFNDGNLPIIPHRINIRSKS